MRYLLLLAIGLAVGGIATHMVGNVLRMRDAYPRAVMVLMAHHMGVLEHETKSGQCPAAGSAAQLRRIDSVDADIVPAFASADGSIDPAFREAAERLQEAVRKEVATAPGDCAKLSAAMQHIGNACDACHRRFR